MSRFKIKYILQQSILLQFLRWVFKRCQHPEVVLGQQRSVWIRLRLLLHSCNGLLVQTSPLLIGCPAIVISLKIRWSGDSVTLDVRREWSWWSLLLSSCCVTDLEPYRAENEEKLHMVRLLSTASLSFCLSDSSIWDHPLLCSRHGWDSAICQGREQRLQNPAFPLYQHLQWCILR